RDREFPGLHGAIQERISECSCRADRYNACLAMFGSMGAPDVVVVGAGAVGSACAYYLSEAGMNVVLLDQEGIASGASTHATGSFSLLASDFKTEVHLRLGIESYRLTRDLVPGLEELSGVRVLYQRRPSLRLALDEA